MEIRLPIPKNWQDFEMLCHKLWREIWNDPNAQRNGRQGQPQAGVDVWGTSSPRARAAGIQCKDRDGRLGSVLTIAQLEAECINAEDFKPPLDEFTLATTAPRDAKLQEHARTLNNQRSHPFDVFVWSWEDIEEEIRFRPTLASTYYKDFVAITGEPRKLTLSLLAPRDQISAFFSRPAVQASLAPDLRAQLLPLAYELSENAFIHGRASRFSVSCENNVIAFEDDGAAFDPATGLDSAKASLRSHVGSLVFDTFRRRFGADATFHYAREKNLNRLSILFRSPLLSFASPQHVDLTVDLTAVYSRKLADRAVDALAIPDGAREIVLVITNVGPHSGAMEFFHALLRRLRPEMRLKLSVPHDEIFQYLVSWCRDPRVEIELRRADQAG